MRRSAAPRCSPEPGSTGSPHGGENAMLTAGFRCAPGDLAHEQDDGHHHQARRHHGGDAADRVRGRPDPSCRHRRRRGPGRRSRAAPRTAGATPASDPGSHRAGWMHLAWIHPSTRETAPALLSLAISPPGPVLNRFPVANRMLRRRPSRVKRDRGAGPPTGRHVVYSDGVPPRALFSRLRATTSR